MEIFMESRILTETNKFNHGYNLNGNNLNNTNIQEEYERKFDILLNGLLNSKQSINSLEF